MTFKVFVPILADVVLLSNTSQSMTLMEVLELLQNQTTNCPMTVKTTNITRTDYQTVSAAAVWLDLVTYEATEVSPSPAVSVSVFVSMKPLDVRTFSSCIFYFFW